MTGIKAGRGVGLCCLRCHANGVGGNRLREKVALRKAVFMLKCRQWRLMLKNEWIYNPESFRVGFCVLGQEGDGCSFLINKSLSQYCPIVQRYVSVQKTRKFGSK